MSGCHLFSSSLVEASSCSGTFPVFATNEEDEIADWILKAKDWSEDTNAYLARYSGRASASFSLVVTSTAADSVVHTPTSSFPVTGRLREHYQKLLVQLDNLRRIMEKPDAYF